MATASCSSFVDTASAITNYARLGLATQNELPNILRKLLFIREPPHLLEAHLKNNSYLSRNLRAYEWNIIRAVRTHQYNEFDVPLMYKIIRNLNLVPNPTQGWDNQTPPSSTEITVGDDIERIRRIRNEIVHRGNTKVKDPELANYFSFFKDIARRLEVALMLSNREFVSKLENAETCCIDEDTERHYIKRLRELEKYETELAINFAEVRKDLVCLRSQMTGQVSKLQTKIHHVTTEQEEVIPKHIRDINKQGIFGFTPLHVSCDFEVDPAVFDFVLKNKPCINKRASDGSTPLLTALFENNREAVKLLLSHSADCNIGLYDSQAIKDEYREVVKALSYTIKNREQEWLEWFTENCISSVVDYVNQESKCVIYTLGGATPLHVTCFTNDIDMIKLLLERNLDINIRKEDGSTPLFVACMFGFIDIAKILLEHGAIRDICRNDGTSPLEMAKHKNHTVMISLLENPKWKSAKSDKTKKKGKCTVS
ncbi:ANK [Mytilus edulis]|uniref:ANK n=1 Tax=Mytilus edulis TaxID=6550 RepID=A0A8S3QPQ3_MYTED|nr:ANK [Mytilus edulis]